MFDESKLAANNGVSSTVSMKDWILFDLIGFLNIIPIIGSIISLIIYLVIGFGSSSSHSMRNRVRASLMWVVIWVIVALVYLFLLGGLAVLSSTVDSLT